MSDGSSSRLSVRAASLVGACLVAGLALRIHRLAVVQILFGDSFAHASLARQWAAGALSESDPIYFTFFAFPPMVLQRLGVSAHASVVSVSLVAGLAAIVLAFLLARELCRSDWAAALAGTLVAVHPRMVEFSTQGYATSLLAALVLLGVLLLSRGAVRRNRNLLVASFATFGLVFLIRNETLFYLPVILLLTLVVEVYGLRASGWRASRAAGLGLLLYAAVAVLPIVLVRYETGRWLVFTKAATNLSMAVDYDPNRLDSWRSSVWSPKSLSRGKRFAAHAEDLSVRSRMGKIYRNYDILLRFYFNRFLLWPPLLFFICLGVASPLVGASRWILVVTIASSHLAYLPVVIQPQYLVQSLPLLLVLSALGVQWATSLLWNGYVSLVPGAAWPIERRRPWVRSAVALIVSTVLLVPLAGQAGALSLIHAKKRPAEIKSAAEWLRDHADGIRVVFGSTRAYGFYSGLDFRRIPVSDDVGQVLAHVEKAGPCYLAVDPSQSLAPALDDRSGWRPVHRIEGPNSIVIYAYEAADTETRGTHR